MTKLLATTTLLLTLLVSPLMAKETFYNCELTKYVYVNSFDNVVRVLEEKDLKPEIEAQIPEEFQWKFKSTFSMKHDEDYMTFSRNERVFVSLWGERKTIVRVKKKGYFAQTYTFEDIDQGIKIYFIKNTGKFMSTQGSNADVLVRVGSCKKF